MFAVERFGVEPDLMALGKSMGGGVMPIGALLGTEASMDFDDVSTGSTWSWLPAACAAALATLDVFEAEPVLENVMALEAAGLEGLRALADRYEAIGDVRATGCFMAVEFVKNRGTKERDLDLQERVAWGCVRRGLLLDPSTTSLNIQPSLTMPVEEMDTVLRILDEAIAEALAAPNS
jgi:4-aminobutyrate aminotransferase-like enzyme